MNDAKRSSVIYNFVHVLYNLGLYNQEEWYIIDDIDIYWLRINK